MNTKKQIELPTEKTPPVQGPNKLTGIIYGYTKIGKSTFAASFPNALFISTEPGLNHLDTYQLPVRSWEDFHFACEKIRYGNHQFETIIIDTVDNLYKMCSDHICKMNKISHPSDLKWGKGFGLVNKEFQGHINGLARLDYGLFLISHSQDKEIDLGNGKTMIKTFPTLPDSSRKFILGLVDLVLFFCVDRDNKRVIHTKPSIHFEAGDRTNRLDPIIPMDYNVFYSQLGGKVDPGIEMPPAFTGDNTPDLMED